MTQEMNTIDLFVIQTGQDSRTLIKFFCFSFYGMRWIWGQWECKNQRESGQYPATLTVQAWSIKNLVQWNPGTKNLDFKNLLG